MLAHSAICSPCNQSRLTCNALTRWVFVSVPLRHESVADGRPDILPESLDESVVKQNLVVQAS